MNLPQDMVAVMNKIEDLLSRIVIMERIFRGSTEDVAEQERRNVLLKYAIASPLDSALSSFQYVQGGRGKTEEVV